MTKKKEKKNNKIVLHTEIFLMTNNAQLHSLNLELQLRPMFVEMMMEMSKDQQVKVNTVYQ